MVLFADKEVRIRITETQNILKGEISRINDCEIKTSDNNEWIDYYYSQYYIAPIVRWVI